MSSIETELAQDLLEIGAVTLRPDEPFTWASGLKSPIYTDNRLTIGYPAVRSKIADGLAEAIKAHYPEVTGIGGVATAGIPHAALVADRLDLPLIYVRSKPKDHGQGRQTEGHLPEGAKIVLIDDLLSTGGSVLKAVTAVQNEGITVLGVAAIFTYELPAAEANFAAQQMPFFALTNYSSLIETAEATGRINAGQLASLHEWRQDPKAWGEKHAKV